MGQLKALNLLYIKEGKILAYEIGANFSVLNISENKNLKNEIKMKFDNILDEIVNYINMSKNTITKDDINPKTTFNKDNRNKNDFNLEEFVIDNAISPLSFIRDINNKLKNEFKDSQNYLFNICNLCFGQLSIRINDQSNIIIIYCDKCKTEPIGLSIEQFLEFNKKNIWIFIVNIVIKF